MEGKHPHQHDHEHEHEHTHSHEHTHDGQAHRAMSTATPTTIPITTNTAMNITMGPTIMSTITSIPASTVPTSTTIRVMKRSPTTIPMNERGSAISSIAGRRPVRNRRERIPDMADENVDDGRVPAQPLAPNGYGQAGF